MTIILDTETTGLHAGTDELLQISIIDDSGETLIDQYLQPSVEDWPEAAAINHITPDMVRDCPHISDPDLHDRIQSVLYNADTIIGYNTQFDIGFLLAAGFAIPDVPQIDVMREFAEIYGQISDEHGGYKWQKLTTAASYYGYDWDIDAHNSLGDCRATLYVYKQIQHHNLMRCCPFCGQKAGYAAGVIRCVDCGLDVSASYDHLDARELIQAYNRRADDKPHGLYSAQQYIDQTLHDDDQYQRCDRCGTYVHRDSMYAGICAECQAEDAAQSERTGWHSIEEILKEVLPDETD